LIQADTGDLATAKANRLEIEAAVGSLTFPPGVVEVDQVAKFKAGVVYAGHPSGTVLRNNYSWDYAAVVLGDGPLYSPTFARMPDGTAVTNLAAGFGPGDVCYPWVWGSLQPGPRLTVLAVSGDVLTFDAPIPPGAFTNCKLLHGRAVEYYTAGQGYVDVIGPHDFTASDTFYLTMGPKVANECYGQVIDVDRVEAQRLWLRSPVLEDFTQAAVVRVAPSRATELHNLAFDNPMAGGLNSFQAKWTLGLVLENCGSLHGPLALTASQGALVHDAAAQLALNTLRFSTVSGSAYSIGFEEGCYDNTLLDLTVFDPNRAVHGVYSNPSAPSGRFRLERVRVANTGRDAGQGPGGALYGTFHDSLFRDVTTVNSPQPCRLIGDNLRLEDVTVEGPLVLAKGRFSLGYVRAASLEVAPGVVVDGKLAGGP
jgi:hypothetical protein